MRRIIAGVLFVTLLAQSSGAQALATTSSGQPLSIGSALVALAAPFHAAWLNSRWHAMLSGQIDRYDAMHAPRPTFPRVIRITQAPDASRRKQVRLEHRDGRSVVVPGLHKPEAIDPRKAPKDPLAMRKSGKSTTRTFAMRWSARGRFSTGVAVTAESTSSPLPGVCPDTETMLSPLVSCGPSPRPTGTPVIPPTPTPTPSPTPSPTPTPTATPVPTPCPFGDSGIPPDCTGATPTPEPTSAVLAPSTTGINHYWTYEEEPLPGIGKAMVNVGNGNLVVQVDDLDVPERGIDLAFRRTYNSQSQHDANGDDGSTPSVFGNGWTNTFDAHLSYDATDNIISVYDIDGARYDFCADGDGDWYGCTSNGANDYTQLTSDGACGYYWTKKTGTAYYFEAPDQPSTCTSEIPAGLSGRIMAIQGRNVNNSLTFTYSWANGDATNPENLTQIVVSHSDGQSVTLTFGLLDGSGPDELQSITRPDNATISYEYDANGELLEVDRPGNDTTEPPQCSQGEWRCIPETYTYYEQCSSNGLEARPAQPNYTCNEQQTYVLESANSPRYTESYNATGGSPTEGDTVNFAYDSVSETGHVTSMTDNGVVNFTPDDHVSAGLGQGPLQPDYPTGMQSWYTESFSGYGSGVTTVCDSDGHARMWTTDSLWRVTQTQEWTGSQWLVSYESWDDNDNLLQFTDERDYISTFAYDSNGNAIMEAQPELTTSMGTFQPTAWFQYDQYNNLLYYCDPNWVHEQGGDYPNGSDPCTGSPSGVVHYVWSTGSSPELYGELTDTYTPLGYHHHLSYDENGMPLSVVGDSMSQADGTERTPDESFTYDAYGNLQTYNPGNGTWHLTYDELNRVTIREDPDSVYSYICYFADGSTQETETAYQHVSDGGTPGQGSCSSRPPTDSDWFTYDADGSVRTQTRHFGGAYQLGGASLATTAGVTKKFYDADDRLVEVEQPYDSTTDLYTNPWITRYLYDLSQNGTVSFDNEYASFSAHGNLYDTQELLPSGNTTAVSITFPFPITSPSPVPQPTPFQPTPNTQYQDTKATAFDALDRPTAKYSFVESPVPDPERVNTETLTYDANPTLLGFLSEDCNAVEQCQTYSYDPRGSESEITFSDATPSRSYEYDPDGRTISITSSVFGAQSFTYDADSRLITSQDPSSHVTSPALLTHHYYADGKEESLDVSSSALNQTSLFTDSYRTDGKTQTQAIDDGSVSGIVNPGTTTVAYTYTAAGRLTGRSESGVAANSTPDTISHDTYGRESGDTFASASLSNFEYDMENEPLGYTYPETNDSAIAYYGYNLRGELSQEPSAGALSGSNHYADGAMLELVGTTGVPVNQFTFDDRMAVDLSSAAPEQCKSIKNNLYCGTPQSSWSYDDAGRLEKEGGGGGPLAPTFSLTRSYDAENHLTTTALTVGSTTAQVQWGPNGHPIKIGTAEQGDPTQSDTLHWNGDSLLFTTDAQGQLDDIKIGAQGDILPLDPGYNGLTFYDRSPSGEVMGCHNAAGATFEGATNPFSELNGKVNLSPCWSRTGQMPTSIDWWGSYNEQRYYIDYNGLLPPLIGAGAGVLGMPRTDGITDGFDTIQGARSYDSNAGTWTTPDVYQGDVHDPASQKSYMWNGNNPESYIDPSGYLSGDNATSDAQCGDACAHNNSSDPVNGAADQSKTSQAVDHQNTLQSNSARLSSAAKKQTSLRVIDHVTAHGSPLAGLTLWRAVSTPEKNDIENQCCFRPNPNGDGYQLSKLFFKTYDAMRNFARNYPDLKYGVKADVPGGTPMEEVPSTSTEPGIVSIPSENLPEVQPGEPFPLDVPIDPIP